MFGMMPWGGGASGTSGLKLLLHFDNDIVDATGLNTATTNNTAFYTGVGLAGYQIGCTSTAGKVEIANSTHIAQGAQDYCLEGWLYSSGTVSSSENPLFDIIDTSSGFRDVRVDCNRDFTTVSRATNSSGATGNVNNFSFTRVVNTLYHWALYRIGNNVYFALNGTVWLAYTQTFKSSASAKTLIIGNRSGVNVARTENKFDEIRMIIGDGLVPYGASNFTPPTAPFTV